MKQALLDTDTVSYFFRGLPPVVAKVDKYLQEHGMVHISIVTYYEIMNGLLFKDAKKQLEKFETFVQLNNVLPLTLESAKIAAFIYADLRKQGRLIGHNDVLMAGIAKTNNLKIITNNTSHFNRIKNLEIDNWIFEE
jgi:predicted nucleic acid-binding protein